LGHFIDYLKLVYFYVVTILREDTLRSPWESLVKVG